MRLWRDTFRYNLSPGRKRDIDLTVTDLELWKQVLVSWGYWKQGKWKSFNPFAVGHQLSEYERLERKGKVSAYSGAEDAAYARYCKARGHHASTWQD